MTKIDTAATLENQPFLEITTGAAPGLIVVDGPKAGTVYYMTSEFATIGEGADNDISLQEKGVEPFHAIIRRRPQKTQKTFFIYDVSNAPTQVNGMPVSLRHPLVRGDRITIGSVVLEFFA